MQNKNIENQKTQNAVAEEEEEQQSMEFLKTQGEITVIDIPEQAKEETKKSKNKDKHVLIFKQFLIPKVYYTAIITYIAYRAFDIAYYTLLNLVFGVDEEKMESTNQKEIEQQLKENTIGIIISTCIIAPFIEEFIFRSVIFKIINWAGKKVQKNKKFIGIVIRILAFLISSFLFAFGHYNFDFKVLASEILSFSSYFFMGIALALAYDHDGYILASIFTHMLNNIIAVLIILYIDDDITNGSIIIKNFLNSF